MKRFKAGQTYLLFIFILSVFLITGCGGGDWTGHWLPSPLVSIEVTPVNPSIDRGTLQQFKATGIYPNNARVDLTSSVTWTSSNTAVSTISNAAGLNGLATSKAVGTTTITATDPATGKAGTTTLTVTAATLVSIAVTPVNPSIARGTNQQFIATGTYTDATRQNLTSSVIWTSSNAAVATISNAAGFNGLATALAIGGPITITATDPANPLIPPGTATLTVTAATLSSIAVTPPNPSIPNGTKQQFTATGTFSDLTTQNLTSSVTWTSSNTAVATISNLSGSEGLATALTAGGPINITATDPATGIPGTTTLTVTSATLSSIAVTPATAGVPVGGTQQFIATGTYSIGPTRDLTSSVTWTTTPLVSPVATISNAAGFNGLATGLTAGGPITITATDPTTLIAGTAALTVTNAPILVAAAPFGGFGGGAGMTNQGTLTVITGDIGTTGVSTTMTGFHDSTGDVYTETTLNIGNVTGRIYTAPPPPVIPPVGAHGGTAVTMAIATAAANDALNAFNYLAGLAPTGPDPSAAGGELGGLTLGPGVYKAAGDTFKITSGDLTLNGTASDIWVFQMGTSLTVGAPGIPRTVHLTGAALAKNVFWQVGSAARIENRCSMEGTIIASAGVTISTAGELSTTTLNGRALSLNASVTMVNTIINVPAP